jgi:hypothetical protein
VRITGALFVMLAASGACSQGSSSAKKQPESAAEAALSSTSARQDRSLPQPAAAPSVNFADLPQLAVPYVARLQAALLADDQEGFARLLSYPLLVNTPSRCAATIASEAVFLAHFEEIVTSEVASVIKAAKPPFAENWRGAPLGRGEVLINPVGSAISVTEFNTKTWRLDLPCAGEPDYVAPEELSGVWIVTSFAILQGAQLIPRSPTTWLGRTLDLDLKTKRAVLNLDLGRTVHCAVARSATWSPNDISALGAPRVGLSQPDAAHFIDLECRFGRTRYVERVDILATTALALVGDDNYLLVLKRAGTARGGHLLKPDAACGSPNDRCPKNQICMATREESTVSLLETCRQIN